MLYYLFESLNAQGVPGMGAFTYISTRAALALIVSLLISTLIGSKIIDWLRSKQMSDAIRPLDIEGQMAKVGTHYGWYHHHHCHYYPHTAFQ